MCRLVMRENNHYERKYFDETHELAQPEYRVLINFAWLDLNKDDY